MDGQGFERFVKSFVERGDFCEYFDDHSSILFTGDRLEIMLMASYFGAPFRLKIMTEQLEPALEPGDPLVSAHWRNNPAGSVRQTQSRENHIIPPWPCVWKRR